MVVVKASERWAKDNADESWAAREWDVPVYVKEYDSDSEESADTEEVERAQAEAEAAIEASKILTAVPGVTTEYELNVVPASSIATAVRLPHIRSASDRGKAAATAAAVRVPGENLISKEAAPK